MSMGGTAGNAISAFKRNPFDPAGISSGGKGGSAPTPPDFAEAARAQAESGRINQANPFGTASWSTGPDGRPMQTTELSSGLGQGVQNLMGEIGNQQSGDAARQAAADAYYGQATSRLDPQWQQRREQFDSQMAGQGLDPGSEAYNNAYGNFSRAQNDAYSTAGREAQTTGQTLGMQREMLPYGELGSLQELSAGLNGQTPQTQYLNAANELYQGQQNQYGTQQAGKNSMMGGAASIGGSIAIMA